MNEQLIDTVVSVPLVKIVPNRYQPRTTMNPDELQTLAESIKRNTMMQKPTARALDDGCYELAFGHRRFEAYKLLAAQDADFESMPLIVRDLTNEQMFEFAWEENREREDLNPIDEGEAYATYMREFNKTSKEAGAYFHVSEETIRQKNRYLKLPEPVKEKMRAGEINENTARSLMSMQRVASAEVVIKTAERIEANKDQYLPEDVIEREIGRLDNVVEMWDSEGKPRAGRSGWLLDMKKFPNGMLPRMNEQMVGKYESQVEHLIDPPACTACPFYTKVRGTHYCGLKFCYERKQIAWGAHLVDQASKNLKIPVYNKEEDGGYVLLFGYESSHKKVFTSRNAGLRLLPRSEADRYASQWGFEGVNDDHVFVVATGQAMDKLDNTGRNRSKGGKKSEKEKAEMRMMRVYRMRRKELMWEFTGIAQSMFEIVPESVLKKMNTWHNISIDDGIPDDQRRASDSKGADYQRRALVWRLIMGSSSYYRRESLVKQLTEFQNLTQTKPTKALTNLAQQFDAEINIAAAPKRAK